MKVRMVFYKDQLASWTDFAISAYTFIWNPLSPPYSHCEIGFEIDGIWQYFSSSIRDNGTRWKDDVLKYPERWDVYEIEGQDDAVERMIARARKITGKKYDVLGILGFITITGQVLNKKDQWYCSEACFYVFTGVWLKRVSPRALWIKIKNVFNKTKQGEKK